MFGQFKPTETGGPLIFEQAAYDVLNYDITLNIDPTAKSISGNNGNDSQDRNTYERHSARS